MTIAADIQKLEPGTIVELFDLDLTGIGSAAHFRFHAGKNGLINNIVWQGIEYSAFPVEADGFELTGNGQMPRPRISVANVTGIVSAALRDFNDLVGAKVTRKRTLSKYLDAVNFPGGVNPTADPGQEFADEVFFIDRKASENKITVTFELASPWDVQGVKLPRRQCIANTCTWKYRSAECGYAGGPVADKNDNPTANSNLDACGKRLTSCRLRFGTYAELPFGAFPATGLLS